MGEISNLNKSGEGWNAICLKHIFFKLGREIVNAY